MNGQESSDKMFVTASKINNSLEQRRNISNENEVKLTRANGFQFLHNGDCDEDYLSASAVTENASDAQLDPVSGEKSESKNVACDDITSIQITFDAARNKVDEKQSTVIFGKLANGVGTVTENVITSSQDTVNRDVDDVKLVCVESGCDNANTSGKKIETAHKDVKTATDNLDDSEVSDIMANFELLDSKNNICDPSAVSNDTSSTVKLHMSLKRPSENAVLETEFIKKRSKASPDVNIVNGCVLAVSGESEKSVAANLDAIVKVKVEKFFKEKKVAIVSKLQKQIEELQKTNTLLLNQFKELQKQIVEASIIKQRWKRNNANCKVSTKNICLQVDEIKLQASQRQQAVVPVSVLQHNNTVPKPVLSTEFSSSLMPAVSPRQVPHSNQMPMKNTSVPTVRQLINTQKAAAATQSVNNVPNILRHAASLPLFVDLTDDDDTSTARSNQCPVSTNLASINRSTGSVGLTVRPVQTVVALQVPLSASLNANSVSDQFGGQQGCLTSQSLPNGCGKNIVSNSSNLSLNSQNIFNGSSALRQSLTASTLAPLTCAKLPLQPAVAAASNSTPTKNLGNSVLLVESSVAKHPAPLPVDSTSLIINPQWKAKPPVPVLKLQRVEQGIVLSWNIVSFNKNDFAEITSYQLFAYQESSMQPSSTLWKKVGDVKALPLPMACTLTQFQEGNTYHFAVRAVDIHKRFGPFSEASSIYLSAH